MPMLVPTARAGWHEASWGQRVVLQPELPGLSPSGERVVRDELAAWAEEPVS